MADFNALEAQFSDRQPNTTRYLYNIHNEVKEGQEGQYSLLRSS